MELQMEALTHEVARLLRDTLSPQETLVSSATEGLHRLSDVPFLPRSLLALTTGSDDFGLRLAAATYLKNFIKQSLDSASPAPVRDGEFRNQLVQTLLRVEQSILKVLIEGFRLIIVRDFVRGDSWPELVPELKSVIGSSNLIVDASNSQWKTINALTMLQVIVKQFQYFLNPKIKREPVPPQLELVATEILVPMQAVFNHFLEKVISVEDAGDTETKQLLLIICKCIYFSVRSYMPSALIPLLHPICMNLCRLLDSLNLVAMPQENTYSLKLKMGKRSLIIFNVLVTRHRKHADKLMPNIINSSINIAKQSSGIDKMNFLSERIISLSLDVISHVLETGPGWRIVSPYFASLIETIIFPALVLNSKDFSLWEDDQEEFMQRNFPCDLDEISGWNEDLFTARKSATNLLGVISLSKGPPMVSNGNTSSASAKRKKGAKNNRKHCSTSGELLVIPFLSKFPTPFDAKVQCLSISYDYFGVLLAYGGLQDFLKERNSEYVAGLMQTRVLPLYLKDSCLPHLIAAANWIIGELASCLPQEMSTSVYESLVKSLNIVDEENCSCYPVRASAAGTIAKLLENDYSPPEWMPILECLISRIGNSDENESSLLLQLVGTVFEIGQENVAIHIPDAVSHIVAAISSYLPSSLEPWPQVVEHGFATLAMISRTWGDSKSDDLESKESNEWRLGWAIIARSFSGLLQQAWLKPIQAVEEVIEKASHPFSSIDDASTLLVSIMEFIIEVGDDPGLKIIELLVVWSGILADWHAWEEVEDSAIFSSIKHAVHLHIDQDSQDFFMQRTLLRPSLGLPQRSIAESLGLFICNLISDYPPATCKACTAAHLLLHCLKFSPKTENLRQSLAIAFVQAAFSRFKDIREKPLGLWKPLLLIISSCYWYYPEIIEKVLESSEEAGFTNWVLSMATIMSSSFDPALALKSEIKLAVIALGMAVERILCSPLGTNIGVVQKCFTSLLEACVHLKKVDREKSDDEDDSDSDDEIQTEDTDEESDDGSEDSDGDEYEETEEEFLDRYAKVASRLENEGVIEEGLEDEMDELELGVLEEVDVERTVKSLLEKHHQFLLQGQYLQPEVIATFVNALPECKSFFPGF